MERISGGRRGEECTAQCLLPERCYDQGDAVGSYPDQGMFGSKSMSF